MAEGTIVLKSTATKTLEDVSSVLDQTKSIIGNVHLPMAQIVIIFNKLDGYIADALDFLGFVDEILKVLHEGLQLCKYLGQLIPEVGPILANAAAMIERLQIEQTVRKIVHQVRSLVEKGRDGAVKRIKQAATQVSAKLESLLNQLPGWIDTLTIVSKLFHLVDVGAYLFSGGKTDDLIKEALKKLAGGALEKIELVKASLEPVEAFLKGVWASFRDAILKPLQEGFSAILGTLRPVMDVVRKCLDICSTIKDWFQPFFWVLGREKLIRGSQNAVQWIFQRTVGWLIDKVMKELGFKDFIESLVQRIKDALGITRIEEEIRQLMESAVQEVLKPLAEIADPEQVKSIAVTVVEFSKGIEELRKDPAQKLIKLFQDVLASSGALPGYKPGLPYRWFDPVSGTVVGEPPAAPVNVSGSGFHDVDVLSHETHKDKVVKEIEAFQDEMDHFVENADNPSGFTDVNPSAKLPKFGYALFDGDPVSILIRIGQKRVVDQQAACLLEPLVKLPSPEVIMSSMDGATAPSKSSSEAKFQGFDNYAAKRRELLVEIGKAKAFLARVEEAAIKVDDGFSSFKPEALAFCGYYASMLGGLDPVLKASQELLGLPLKYESVLTQNMSKWVKDLGLPDVLSTHLVPGLYKVVGQAKAAIAALEVEKQHAVQKATTAEEAYAGFHAQVARACSKDRFPNVLGLGVINISFLIRVLKSRLDSTENAYEAIHNIGESISLNRDKMMTETDTVWEKLGAVYNDLLPVMDVTLKDIKEIPERLVDLYDSMAIIHRNVQTFFQATATILDLCRKVEAKVMAADKLQTYCARINNAIGPFEVVLEEFGVHPDDPTTGGEATSASVTQNLLKGVNERLSQPLESLSDVLSEGLFLGIQALVEHYINLDYVNVEMDALEKTLRQKFSDDIERFDKAVQKLIQLVEPKSNIMYTVPASVDNGSSNSNSPTIFDRIEGSDLTRFQVSNPVLDENTAQALQQILREINTIATSLAVSPPTPGGVALDPVVGFNSVVVTPKWATPGINPEPIVNYLLTTRGREWDALEPSHPSEVFIEWFGLLENLDRIMAQRLASQPLSQPIPASITADAGRSSLWTLLQEKACVGGTMYQAAIGKPLRGPLRDRLDMLLQGMLRLEPGEAADNDFLKKLPVPVEGSMLMPAYFLRVGLVAPMAAGIANGTSKAQGYLAAPTLNLGRDRDEFETVAGELYPRLAAAENIYKSLGLAPDIGTSALTSIRVDYNLMDARKLLEVSGSEGTARKFLDIVGDGGRLHNL
ncbi:hypothetical protein ColTof4_01150 [Colletotrichum tofieldiae]|nr:hypothetical protein ColTof3_08376 [Colletotrichum tofieldiae]GKT68727.1 hypothetical protein ColTof4_01150 [Colletotrichum tofieldiae]